MSQVPAKSGTPSADWLRVKKRIIRDWSWETWLYYYWVLIQARLFIMPKYKIRMWIKRRLGRFFVEHDDFIERCKDLYWDMEEWS